MTPFYCTISGGMTVMVIPDTQAHVDGHPVLTYSYTLYRSMPSRPVEETAAVDKLLAPDKIKHKDYLGTIFFDQPYKAFSYTADGLNELEIEDVQLVIDQIIDYRMNSELWTKQF
jgi:hypothetical protein